MGERSEGGVPAEAPGRDAPGSPALSIVVPAYDESPRLPGSLARMAAHLGERVASTEFVIVDDGSTDGTGEAALSAARDLGISLRVLRHTPNRGKGYAVREGMLAAEGDAVLLTDADLSVDIDHLEHFMARLTRDVALVSGSRHVEGADVAVHQPPVREWLGRVFRQLSSALMVPGVTDFTCGFKLFTRSAAREIFGRLRLWGWGYDVELYFVARRLGLRVVEAPVVWRDDRRSRVRLLHDVPRSLADLVRIRWNDWLGRYARDASLPARSAESGAGAGGPR